MVDVEKVLEWVKLYEAAINHPLPAIRTRALKELKKLDAEEQKVLDEEVKKEAEEAAKGKGKP